MGDPPEEAPGPQNVGQPPPICCICCHPVPTCTHQALGDAIDQHRRASMSPGAVAPVASPDAGPGGSAAPPGVNGLHNHGSHAVMLQSGPVEPDRPDTAEPADPFADSPTALFNNKPTPRTLLKQLSPPDGLGATGASDWATRGGR